MSKPVVTSKNIKKVPGSFDWGTTEYFIDGESVGRFDYYEEDASAGAVESIFEELHDRGIVDFKGGAT